MSFPSYSAVKNPAAMQEIQFSFWIGRLSPGRGNGNPLQYSCPRNHMDRGNWWATDHGVIEEFDPT